MFKNPMLKKRIITAAILIPLFVLLVLKLSSIAFCLVTTLVVLWGAYEWSFFMGIKTFPHCFFYPVFMIFVLLASLMLPEFYVLGIACATWLSASVLVVLYPKANQVWSKGIILRAIFGVLVLVPCWITVNLIHEQSVYTLLFLFVLIWGADTGAFFAGRRFGKHKLCPQVSPGKTWEGLYGAVFVALIITLTALAWSGVPYNQWFGFTLVSVITVLFSIMGDLFESMLKRQAGLKDSGTLLPGHGGILDRIDSLTAAAPIFALGVMILGKIYY